MIWNIIYIYIRLIICEPYETTNTLNDLFENEEEKNDYIINMKKDKTYYITMELESFSQIFKIKI